MVADKSAVARPTHRIAWGLLLKANLRHDITQEVIAEGLVSPVLSSDLRRKWTGGLHMLGGGNQASAVLESRHALDVPSPTVK